MGKRGTKPQKQISTEWSPELAYAIGLITTDGCLSKDRRHIDFTSKDIQLIQTFKGCLGIQHIKIGRKRSGSNRVYLRVQVGDVNFYRWLERVGLTSHKSRTLTQLTIPKSYFFDFVRGCFDGDGTIYSLWDTRWADSFMFYIAFASGSKHFLLWLQNRIHRLSAIQGHIVSSTKNTFQLRYAKRESLTLFRRMFYNDTILHLQRKFTKAQKIFDIHRRVVERNKFARVVK